MGKTKIEILKEFALFSVPTGGIGSWLTEETHDDIFERLSRVDDDPLTAVQLNQLLVLGHEAPVADGFFQYYWLQRPVGHPYEVEKVPGFQSAWLDSTAIVSLEHLKWGLHRLYIDALLYFGNVRTAFRNLRDYTVTELENFFTAKRFDTAAIKRRGPSLPLREIAKDSRYLISEMACKSYGDSPEVQSDLGQALLDAYKTYAATGNPSSTIRQLLEVDRLPGMYQGRQQEFIFSADEVLDEPVGSEQELRDKYQAVAAKFFRARKDALDNTRYYLSMVSDLDVYVATSMRR